MTVRPRAARERLVAVLVVLALGGAIVLASTQVFATVLPPAEKAVPVTGQQVAPALAPLGIVLLALAAALTIAGRVARIVLGVVLLLLGAVVVLLALPSVLDPLAGTRGAVSTATGLIGHAPSAGRGTAWPLVAAVAGVLAALAGFGVLVLSPGWPTGGGRYRQQGVPSARRSDPVDEWDALTAGTDPTHDEDAAGPPPSATP